MSLFKRLLTFGEDRNYVTGIAHYNVHEYREAIAAFLAVINKKNIKTRFYKSLATFYAAQAHRNLGTVAFAAGKFGEALQEFKKALSLNPEHVDLHFFMGICFNNMGDFANARKAFQAALDADPDHLPTRMKLAVVFHNLKMWTQAAATYQAILARKPGYADVHYRLGLALLGAGDLNGAVAAFEAAVAINPDYTDARIKAGICRAQLCHDKAALAHLQHVIARSPKYADVHYYIGLVHDHAGHYQAAAEALERAVGINPGYKDARLKLVSVYLRLSRHREALEVFRQTAAQAPEDEGLQLAGEIIHQRLAPLAPDSSDTAVVLEEILGDPGSIPEALQNACCQIDITPHFTEMISLVNVGGNEREGLPITRMLVPLFEEHVRAHPTYPDLRHGLGLLYMKLRQFDLAEAAFEEAVTLNPDYLKARIDLLKTKNQTGKYEDALVHGAYVLSRGVLYPDVFLAVGEARLALGRIDAALDAAASALKQKPSYADAYYLTGRALQRKARPAEAVAAFRQCLALSPAPGIRQAVQEALKALTPPEA